MTAMVRVKMATGVVLTAMNRKERRIRRITKTMIATEEEVAKNAVRKGNQIPSQAD